jgi:hypothetical protein
MAYNVVMALVDDIAQFGDRTCAAVLANALFVKTLVYGLAFWTSYFFVAFLILDGGPR